jgi:ABC-type glycerol-3-phosphate transport system substrate-binding protein
MAGHLHVVKATLGPGPADGSYRAARTATRAIGTGHARTRSERHDWRNNIISVEHYALRRMLSMIRRGMRALACRMCLAATLVALIWCHSALAAKTSLRLMHCWGEQRNDWVNEMVEEFMASNPDISVTTQLVGVGDALLQAFMVSFLGGAAPDVVMVHSLNLPGLADMGALASLETYRQAENIAWDTWYPSEIGSGLWKGIVYGFPIRTGGDASSLFYFNRDLFAQAGLDPARPPATWQEVDEMARRLVRYSGDQLQQAAFPIEGGDYYQLSWLGSSGGRLLSDDGLRVEFAEQPAVDATSWAINHFSQRYHGGLPELRMFLRGFVGAGDGAGMRNAFIQGKLGMYNNGSWEYSYIRTANSDLNFGISLRPTKEPAAAHGMHVGTFHYSMSSSSKNPEAAWRLLKWLTLCEDSAGYFMLRQGRPSPVRAFNRNRKYLQMNPDWYVIGEALANVTTLPMYPFTKDVMNVFLTTFDQAVSGKNAPGPVLEDAAVRAQATIEQFWNQRK